jgi:predicted Rossmann-fold nucleotide-binding protein
MRVLVCGGREYNSRQRLFDSLNNVHKYSENITCVISGKAKGADSLGEEWADYVGVPVDPYPALWTDYSHPWSRKVTKNGRSYNVMAGPIRNQQMLDEGKPDLVVAFPGGTGTKDMITRATKAGVMVLEIDRD